jgi:hypothetical protein
MQAEPEISGESCSRNLLSADKKGPGLKSNFSLGGKMQAEPEISGESCSRNLLSADKKGARAQIRFYTRG